MSGILEQMKAQLDVNTQEITALKAAISSMQSGAVGAVSMSPVAASPFASFGTTSEPAAQTLVTSPAVAEPAVPAGLNGDTIVSLITPYIDNPQMKDAFGTAMRSMGINALPETQPHQLAELYTRFQAIIGQFQAGSGAATAAPVTSII